MAASVTKSILVNDVPFTEQECYVSGLEPNVPFNISLLGPTGLSPQRVSWVVSTEATTRDGVFMKHDDSLDSATNDTITLEPDTVSGGDITGAIIRVNIIWNGAGSGGIS